MTRVVICYTFEFTTIITPILNYKPYNLAYCWIPDLESCSYQIQSHIMYMLLNDVYSDSDLPLSQPFLQPPNQCTFHKLGLATYTKSAPLR